MISKYYFQLSISFMNYRVSEKEEYLFIFICMNWDIYTNQSSTSSIFRWWRERNLLPAQSFTCCKSGAWIESIMECFQAFPNLYILTLWYIEFKVMLPKVVIREFYGNYYAYNPCLAVSCTMWWLRVRTPVVLVWIFEFAVTRKSTKYQNNNFKCVIWHVLVYK